MRILDIYVTINHLDLSRTADGICYGGTVPDLNENTSRRFI